MKLSICKTQTRWARFCNNIAVTFRRYYRLSSLIDRFCISFTDLVFVREKTLGNNMVKSPNRNKELTIKSSDIFSNDTAHLRVLQKIYEKPKISIQIIKSAKSSRCKRTNEHWYLWSFLKGTETKYEMKSKRVLIIVKNKNRYKKEKDVETCRNSNRNRASFGSTESYQRVSWWDKIQ